MFHHANLDRSRLWWMLRNNQEEGVCSYYSFPTENAPTISGRGPIVPGGNNFYGAHLNDVVSSTWGFTADDLGTTGAFDSDPAVTLGQATHADILCWLNPESAPYTYDTHVDCLTDSTNCHAVQKIVADESTTAVAVGKNGDEEDALLSSGGGARFAAFTTQFVSVLLVVWNISS